MVAVPQCCHNMTYVAFKHVRTKNKTAHWLIWHTLINGMHVCVCVCVCVCEGVRVCVFDCEGECVCLIMCVHACDYE